jgi:tetratricopeptide (TPR) repeat protein
MNDVINELIHKQQFSKALSEANRIIDEFWRTQILCDILFGIVKNAPKDTEELIDELIESVMKMGKNRYKALIRFSSIMLKSGYYYKSLEVADLISKAEYKSEALINISEYLCKYGNFDKSEIFDRIACSSGKIRIDEIKNQTYKKIIENMVKLGFLQKSMKLSGKITQMKSRQQAKAFIAVAYSKNGEYNKAIDIADTITKAEIQSFILRTIVSDVAKNEPNDKNNKTLIVKLLNIASAIKNEYEKSCSLRDIVVGLVEKHDFQKAIEICDTIDNDFWKADAMMYVAVGLSKNGYYDNALEIVDKIEDQSKRLRAVSKISEGLERDRYKEKLDYIKEKYDI